jgi:hypothetical protein
MNMTPQTEKALESMRQLADRAIQRGNIFTGVADVANFINAYNHLMMTASEEKQNGTITVNRELQTANE